MKKEAKKKIKKTLKNFYQFQIKETKINRKNSKFYITIIYDKWYLCKTNI